MKQLYCLIIGLILSNGIQAQNYTPLLLDSLYTWSWQIGIYGDTIIQESWEGNSYNSEEVLIQKRTPDFRYYYSYSPDTVYQLSETIDNNNDWNIYGKVTLAYQNGDLVTRLFEKYQDDNFENVSIYRYFYSDVQLDSLLLLQHWKYGTWKDFYKKEKTFDSNGNNIEEAEYYAHNNSSFSYSRGKLFEYDEANRMIEKIWVNSSSNGNFFSLKVNWEYGDDELLENIKTCSYLNGICKNSALSTYDYLGQDSILRTDFKWSNTAWQNASKELSFKGPEIYSARADSIHSYNYYPDLMMYIPNTRRYLAYQDLGNDSIYFKEERHTYYTFTNEWLLTGIIEEWYRAKTTTSVQAPIKTQANISIYPNPSPTKQSLNIKREKGNNAPLEILIFDLQGRLVSKNTITNQTSFQAPKQAGIYTILLRENGRMINVSKQVIID